MEPRGEGMEPGGVRAREAAACGGVRRTSGGYEVSPTLLARWKEHYPSINVAREIVDAWEWEAAHPERRKVRIQAFLVGWLKRAQDRALQAVPPPPPRPAILDEPDLPPEVRAANLRRVGEMVTEIAAKRVVL